MDIKPFFRNSEKHIIKLDIFVNFLQKKQFLLFETEMILFLFHFTALKECHTFDSNSASFKRCPLQSTNSCFASLKVMLEKDLHIILHPSINYLPSVL